MKEEEIEQEHDGVIFRALLRVGESTVEANKSRQQVDLVERLESVLEARGITLIREDGQDEYTGTLSRNDQRKKLARRVSFDDARFEETWLSEHSQSVNQPTQPMYPPRSLLSLPPRRNRPSHAERRARSTSSQRSVLRHPAPKSFQTSSSQDRFSEHEDPQNPTLHLEVSQTQLEINADAMLAMTEVRLQRRTLRYLHNVSIHLRATEENSLAIAHAHDRRILLKQALETWHGALLEQQYERRYEQHFQRLESKAERARDLFLITKAFTHWATQCSDERFRTRIAQHYVLRAKYFRRWRTIAVENQTKIRRILCRKYVAIWREKTARRSLSEEYAQAWYEERLTRRCKLSMFWEFCSRQVVDNHDVWVKRDTFSRLRNVLRQRQEVDTHALHLHDTSITQRALQRLRAHLDQRNRDHAVASRRYDHAVSSKAVRSVQIHVKLAPLARDLTLKVDLGRQRKALRVLCEIADRERDAARIRRQMLLYKTWRLLNDGFRVRYVQTYDENRVKSEALYRWYLHMKAHRQERESNAKLVARMFDRWRNKVNQERNQIDYAQAVFAEAQHRRRQQFGFFCLNLAKRKREDARRAAVEFRNSRDVPQIFGWMWKEHQHVQELDNMAGRADFYRVGTKVLRTWNERTTEHKANRRRNAYAHVRARIKIRVVGGFFRHWRQQVLDVQAMGDEAERRAQDRTVGLQVGALVSWRDRTASVAQLEVQSTTFYQERLLRAALGALLAQSSEKAALQQQLEQSNRATDLGLLASALRRLLWESFKAARNRESAEALRLRNRDTHAKQMFRHWAAQTAARRLPPNPPQPPEQGLEEPESPSLRPASRAASRASAATTPATIPASSPPQHPGVPDSTPGYMRTPSRSRRAGRFRALPTPAALTPLAFDSSYLATTPAPLPAVPATATAGEDAGMDALTPQVTPFGRKLRAGGFGNTGALPPSALRTSVLGGATGGGTGKSVRFAGAGGRFGRLKSS